MTCADGMMAPRANTRAHPQQYLQDMRGRARKAAIEAVTDSSVPLNVEVDLVVLLASLNCLAVAAGSTRR
jgi:hypothetical protein